MTQDVWGGAQEKTKFPHKLPVRWPRAVTSLPHSGAARDPSYQASLHLTPSSALGGPLLPTKDVQEALSPELQTEPRFCSGLSVVQMRTCHLSARGLRARRVGPPSPQAPCGSGPLHAAAGHRGSDIRAPP